MMPLKSPRSGFVLLIIFALFYLLPVDGRLLWQPDETRYAEISREMLASGNWMVPRFLGLRYFEKPVAGYWVNSLGQFIFGDSNFAVRAGSVFSMILTVLLVMWLTMRIWRDTRTALLAGIIFMTLFLVYCTGTYAVLDPILMLWLVTAMCCFWIAAGASTRPHKAGGYLLLGMACGMGVMTKGFLALAIPVISVLPWLMIHKKWKDVLLYGWIAILSCTLVVLPWAWTIAQQEPDFWRYFFWVEHVRRFAYSNAQHKAPFWYYLPFLIAGSLPWLGLLPGAIRQGFRDTQMKTRSGAIYLLGWTVMPFIFYSIAKGKLPTYILPCFAPLAILMARYAVDLAEKKGTALKINAIINMGVGVAGMMAVLAFSPWGPEKYQLWTCGEQVKIILAVMAFLCWFLGGVITLFRSRANWWFAAFCPFGLALLAGGIVPDKISSARQPQLMTELVRPSLENSRFILTNNVGIASGIAWQLKRSDIILYAQAGELKYGLQYPDAQGRFISKRDFPGWISEHRKLGKISLILLLSKNAKPEELSLPSPDNLFQQGRTVWLEYLPQ